MEKSAEAHSIPGHAPAVGHDPTADRLAKAQALLLETEMMASLGRLFGIITHEIVNYVSVVSSNLSTLNDYFTSLQKAFAAYEELAGVVGNSSSGVPDTQRLLEKIAKLRKKEDFDLIAEDSPQIFNECREGVSRTQDIVESMRSFAGLKKCSIEPRNLNEGIETTLKLIWGCLKYKCQVHRNLGDVPAISCKLEELNFAFMNLFLEAAGRIEGYGDVTVATEATESTVIVSISDNGACADAEVVSHLLDPKRAMSKLEGRDLGLQVADRIVRNHHGKIEFKSDPKNCNTFLVHLPIAKP